MSYNPYDPSVRTVPGVQVVVISKEDRETYFTSLGSFGWKCVGEPIEFTQMETYETFREWASEYAQRISANLVVEVEDPSYSANPFNNIVYYIWQGMGQPPPPPTLRQIMSPATQMPPMYQPQQMPDQMGNYQQPVSQQYMSQPPVQQVPESKLMGFTCPHCQNPFAAQVGMSPCMVNCPTCSGQLVVSMDIGVPIEEDTAKAEAGACPEPEKPLVLLTNYATAEDALKDCLEKLAMILCKEPCPIKFVDSGEFLHPKITIARNAYVHLVTRYMDLVLVHDGVHDFTLFGNESHGTSSGIINPMRDQLVSMKTIAGPSYMPLDSLRELDMTQREAIARALFTFLTQYIPAV